MIKTKKKFKDKKSNFKETLKSCSESILKSNSKDSRKMEGITLIALVLTILFSYDEKFKFSNSKGFLLQTI